MYVSRGGGAQGAWPPLEIEKQKKKKKKKKKKKAFKFWPPPLLRIPGHAPDMSTYSINFYIITSVICTMVVSMHKFTYDIHDFMHNCTYR